MSRSGITTARFAGPSTASASSSSGSQTVLQIDSHQPSATLRLRANSADSDIQPTRDSRRIQWADDVVDNEGMGKKSSKVCCIYHKPGEPGDSESEDSSDSSDDDDDEPDLSRAQPAGGKGKSKRSGRSKDRDHDHHDHSKEPRRPSPNAYERQPRSKPRRDG